MGRLAGQPQGFLSFFIFCFYNLRVCCRQHDTSIPCTGSLLASAHEADFINFFPTLTSAWLLEVCYVVYHGNWHCTKSRFFFPSGASWTFIIISLHVSPNNENFLLYTCNSVITVKRSNTDAILVPRTQFTFTFPKSSQCHL